MRTIPVRIKTVLKKSATIIAAASICTGMITAPVSAARPISESAKSNIIVRSSSKTIKKSSRNIEPEEWNKQELKAYLFDSGQEVSKYALTGGLHHYNNNYKEKDHMIKVTVQDAGLFYVLTGSEEGTIQIYDQTKKKKLGTLEAQENTEYLQKAEKGDVFYIKLPKKIGSQDIVTAVLKDGFDKLKAGNSYGESGTGKTIYHSFSISKRCISRMALKVMYKNKGNVTAQVQNYVKGKWVNIGYKKTIKPNADDYIDADKNVTNGLQTGKYRVALKAPEGQVYALAYGTSKMNKNVAYKKSKAKKIKKDSYVQNIYTQGETAARWYKFTRTASDKQNVLSIAKETIGGGFKFTIYKAGKNKPIKTINVKTNDYGIVSLPKGKGTYYVKINKLTKKTNGYYVIMDFNQFVEE